MGNMEDKTFLKNFSLVIVALMAIAVVCAIIARSIIPDPDENANPSRQALKIERTQPVGAVRTEMPSAEEMAAAAPPAGAPMDPADIDGTAIYQSVCAVCHTAGVAGAPIPGSDDWNQRAAAGEETLVNHAINGLNAMPAKGGRMDLSDAEVIAAVEHMLAQ